MQPTKCPNCNSLLGVGLMFDPNNHWVRCLECRMQGPKRATSDEAVESWNKFNTHFTCYDAHISMADPDNPRHERQMQFFLTAPNPVEAVRATYRRWEDRHKAVPEYFGELWCIKLHHYTIGPVAEDGTTDSPRGMCIFEWKYDWPGTLEERIQSLAKFTANAPSPA